MVKAMKTLIIVNASSLISQHLLQQELTKELEEKVRYKRLMKALLMYTRQYESPSAIAVRDFSIIVTII
jgi:hypothetical protein